jgi:RimJ/RimL family protein N-acetyltransferase
MTTPAGPVVPTAAGVHLRPWRDFDVSAVLAARSDPEIVQWSPNGCRADPESVREWLAQRSAGRVGDEVSFAVVDTAMGIVVAAVSLRHIRPNHGKAEVGYWTAPTARGRGFSAAAVAVVTGWAFDELRLHRVELYHAVANPASCRVAEKAGFQLEGTMRASYRYGDGKLYDEHIHARLATDPVDRALPTPSPAATS